MANDDSIKRAAIHILRNGLATRAEVANLAGRSHQAVSYWAKDLPPNARAERLQRIWNRALRLKPAR